MSALEADGSGYTPRAIEDAGATVVYYRRGGVAHVLAPLASAQDGPSICGSDPTEWSYWYGTGSYQEWERGRRMPLCTRCLRQLKTSKALPSAWRAVYQVKLRTP